MERRTCNNCHNELQVPPKAKTIRCKCKVLYTVGSSSSPSVEYHNGSIFQKQAHASSSSNKLLRSTNININNMSIETSPWLGFSANTLNSTRHHPRKALLIGVSYQDQKYQLNGTINDAKSMWNLLTNHFKFPKDAICVLTDDNLSHSPTKENMQRALKWLVQDCQLGDSLVFFSGHGLRQTDFKDDEIDGYDETLCPVDFKTAGMIFDTDINDVIVKPLKYGVKLHTIIDACHSGTILDLEHVYKRDENLWMDNKPPSGANKSPIGGVAISLSACADNKLAVDTSVRIKHNHLIQLSLNRQGGQVQAFTRDAMNGALTYIFTKIMKEKGGKITYAELLNEMQKMIESVNDTLCLKSTLIKRIFRNKIVQEPHLSASQAIDINGYLNL